MKNRLNIMDDSCRTYLIILVQFIGLWLYAQNSTFTNPLLPSGADPYSTYHDGYYYYTHTLGDRLNIWKTKSLANLDTAESKTIWIPPENTNYSHDIWAPEVHYINSNWYVYFAADNGDNTTHRMYVLENTAEDPFEGKWKFKGKIADSSDKWAIDGNVFTYKGQMYMVWSGWEGDTNGQQDIYIARMKTPLEIEGERVRISSPTYDWEKHGDLDSPDDPPHVNVNEGPQFITHGDNIFIVYSASGCWTDYYSLGLLVFTGDENLMDSNSWVKSDKPIFKQSIENQVFAPGHNSFFKSPNGKEDWILYHANSKPKQGCGPLRSPRMQRLYWTKGGMPYLGSPVPENVVLEIPGEN